MVLNIVILLISLVIIVIASNLFVDAATSIAHNYKISKMLIALTLASFCTCAPELAISFKGVISNNADITFANVIGSSVVNILLIIGIASIVNPIKIKNITIKQELPLLLIITSIFFLLLLDNTLSKTDGIILILLFAAFCYYLVKTVKKFRLFDHQKPKYSKSKSIFLTVISLILIIVASEYIVNCTISLAESFNISTKSIMMSVVVVGTSLPELMITVTSARKKEFEMAIGNIIGTNIFNICIVLGLPVAIFGKITSTSFGSIDLIVVLLSSFLFYFFGKSEKTISKNEGIVMLVVFVIYYIILFAF